MEDAEEEAGFKSDVTFFTSIAYIHLSNCNFLIAIL